MGADYIGAFCPMELTREEAKERLRRYRPEFLLSVLNDEFGQDFATDEDEYGAAIEWVEGHIDATYDAYQHGSRETTVFRFRDVPILTTGGMTWGDDPTDIYSAMSIVESLSLSESVCRLAYGVSPWRSDAGVTL